MMVPVAPVNKDYGLPTREHNVGTPREALNMQAKAEAGPVEVRTDPEFRVRVFAVNARHHLTALGLADNVRHVGQAASRPSDSCIPVPRFSPAM
jgi:hypothetical protein